MSSLENLIYNYPHIRKTIFGYLRPSYISALCVSVGFIMSDYEVNTFMYPLLELFTTKQWYKDYDGDDSKYDYILTILRNDANKLCDYKSRHLDLCMSCTIIPKTEYFGCCTTSDIRHIIDFRTKLATGMPSQVNTPERRIISGIYIDNSYDRNMYFLSELNPSLEHGIKSWYIEDGFNSVYTYKLDYFTADMSSCTFGKMSLTMVCDIDSVTTSTERGESYTDIVVTDISPLLDGTYTLLNAAIYKLATSLT